MKYLPFTNSHLLIIDHLSFVKWSMENNLLNEKCELRIASKGGQ